MRTKITFRGGLSLLLEFVIVSIFFGTVVFSGGLITLLERIGYEYSIEFDAKGGLEDVERVVHIKHLSIDEQQRINRELEGRLIKYKIIRIQEQFLGSQEALHELITTDTVAESLVRNFEINVKGILKDRDNWSYFEFLYTAADGIVKAEELELRPTYNLEF